MGDQSGQIREVFRVCDKDGDGIISVADMQKVMQEFKRDVSIEDLQAALERLDANGDGVVDFADFSHSLKSGVSWMPSSSKESRIASKPPPPKPAAQDTSAVQMAAAEARRAVQENMRAKYAEAQAAKLRGQEETCSTPTHGDCAAVREFAEMLADSQHALDAAELEDPGDDVAALHKLVGEQRTWLQRLHLQGGCVCQAYESYQVQAEERLQSRNRRLADAMSAAADATAAAKAAENEAAVIKQEWLEARARINKASDAEAEREEMQEQFDALRQSLQAAINATAMAEERSRELDTEGDGLREEISRLEEALTKASQSAKQHDQQVAELMTQLSDAKGQIEELDKALAARGEELLVVTEERYRQQRQLEETQELLKGQKDMMEMLRGSMENGSIAPTPRYDGGFADTMGGGLDGFDLQAETQAAEMDGLLDKLTVLSDELSRANEGSQGVSQASFQTSMEEMQNKMQEELAKKMTEMQTQMAASMQVQLAQVVSPRKDDKDWQKEHEMECMRHAHEVKSLEQRYETDKSLAGAAAEAQLRDTETRHEAQLQGALAELRREMELTQKEAESQLLQAEARYKAESAQAETAHALDLGQVREQAEVAERARLELDAALGLSQRRLEAEQQRAADLERRCSEAERATNGKGSEEGTQEEQAKDTGEMQASLVAPEMQLTEALRARSLAEEELVRAQAALQALEDSVAAKEARAREVEALKAKQLEMEAALQRAQASEALSIAEKEREQARAQCSEVRHGAEIAAERHKAEVESLQLAKSTVKGQLAECQERVDKLTAWGQEREQSEAALREEVATLQVDVQGKEEAEHNAQEAIELAEKMSESDAAMQQEVLDHKEAAAVAEAKMKMLEAQLDKMQSAAQKAQDDGPEGKAATAPAAIQVESVLRVNSAEADDGGSSQLQQLEDSAGLLGDHAAEMERVHKLSNRLGSSIEELAQCLGLIDEALCSHFVQNPAKALEIIQKELRVAAGSRQVIAICREELFGGGGAARGRGGLIHNVLTSATQAVNAAEEQAEETAQQMSFVCEENERLGGQLATLKMENEQALKRCNGEWKVLNERLHARKVTSDMMVSKLQEQLVQMAVSFKQNKPFVA